MNKKMTLEDKMDVLRIQEHDERTKIVIVGAGVAGIAAAATLQKAGYDFIILEGISAK